MCHVRSLHPCSYEPCIPNHRREIPIGQGFAVFGHVTSGMEIVRKIHDSPAGPSGAKDGVSAGDQRLTPPIKILSIRRK